MLSGDQAVIDMFHETGGVGDFGRFLAEAGAPVRAIELQVLNDGNAAAYWQEVEEAEGAAATVFCWTSRTR